MNKLIRDEQEQYQGGASANAARIVLCVNSHDALLSALVKMVEHAELAHWDKQDSVFGITCDQARALIAKHS